MRLHAPMPLPPPLRSGGWGGHKEGATVPVGRGANLRRPNARQEAMSSADAGAAVLQRATPALQSTAVTVPNRGAALSTDSARSMISVTKTPVRDAAVAAVTASVANDLLTTCAMQCARTACRPFVGLNAPTLVTVAH